jgi:hypothetical protein
MKKFMLVLIIAVSAIGAVSAQNWGGRRNYSQPVTVNGTLQLQDGFIAVVNGNTVYYVPSLERYIGFIDGLKEGAQVNLEGYVVGNGNVVQPSKLTLNGKSYDLLAAAPQGGPNNGYGWGNGYHRNNAGHGSCCWGW